MKPHSRQISHGKRWVAVEMVGFNEPLEQIPTHLGRFIGAQRKKGGGMDARTRDSTGVASNGQMAPVPVPGLHGSRRVQRARAAGAGGD